MGMSATDFNINDVLLSTDKKEQAPKNPPADTAPKPAPKTYNSDTIAISFIKENHDMHWYSKGDATTYGVRLEGEKVFSKSENGIFKLDVVKSTNITGNSNSFNIEHHQGIKIKAGDRSNITNAYVSGTVGGNIGWLGGSFTAGLGARAAVGAEIGPVYAEAFREAAMNYNAKGYVVGVKFAY